MEDTKDMNKVLGRNIAEARRRAKLTQTQVGEGMERYIGHTWSKQVVSFVERGHRQLDANELLMLAAIVRAPVYELMLLGDGESIKLPSGFQMDAGTVRQHVAGDVSSTPLALDTLQHFEEVASIAEQLASRARGAIRALDRKPKTKRGKS